MKLGAFSVSLTVKDIEKSKEFYEKIGFIQIGGVQAQGWLILRNGDHTIGLFQGMFDSNLMTFNPGWDKDCNELDEFDDVRVLHKEFNTKGIETVQENLADDSGPGSFSVIDPDGNIILVDQNV